MRGSGWDTICILRNERETESRAQSQRNGEGEYPYEMERVRNEATLWFTGKQEKTAR